MTSLAASLVPSPHVGKEEVDLLFAHVGRSMGLVARLGVNIL